MDVQLYLYINGSWQEYNPKPASHTHTISDLPNNLLTTNTTQTITGKKTITTNDLNMDGSSVAYVRPDTTGGWARGFWWQTRSTDTPANNRIGGIGVLGSNQSVSYFYIGYGSSPWTNPAVEVRSDYTNIRNGLKLNGNDVATVNLLNEYAEKDHTHNGIYEPVFTKNTAFNKNFGTGNGDVARGDHTHTVANITNLQTTLNGKANSSHTHGISDITDLQTTLNRKSEWTQVWSGAINLNSYTNSYYHAVVPSNSYIGKRIAIEVQSDSGTSNTSKIIFGVLGSSSTTTSSTSISRGIGWNYFDGTNFRVKTLFTYTSTSNTTTIYVGHLKTLFGTFSGTTIDWKTSHSETLYMRKIWVIE